MSQITTHVLDVALGTPARGLEVTLFRADGVALGSASTDSSGRISDLGPDRLEVGEYRLTFATVDYFKRSGRDTFFAAVSIDFVVIDNAQAYHIPLLLSPFAYSTYRGSH